MAKNKTSKSMKKYWKNAGNRKVRRDSKTFSKSNTYRKVFDVQWSIW